MLRLNQKHRPLLDSGRGVWWVLVDEKDQVIETTPARSWNEIVADFKASKRTNDKI